MVERKTIVLKAIAIFIIVPSTKSKYLSMDENGTVSSQEPWCEKDNYIRLGECMYHKRNCPQSICLTESRGNLSADGISMIYHSCSMKERCKNLAFPARDIQVNGYNVIDVSFQCQAKRTFYDICSDSTTTTNERVNLISGDNVTFFEKCGCLISGIFRLTVQDIRLKATNAAECCPSLVQVDREKYSCNVKSANYGAVFQKTQKESMQLATVVLAPNSWNMTPEMVWISVEPIKSASITFSCSSVARKPEVTTFSSQHTVKSASPKSSTDAVENESSSFTKLADHYDQVASEGENMTTVIILVTLILVLALVAFIVYLIRKSLKEAVPRILTIFGGGYQYYGRVGQEANTMQAKEADLAKAVYIMCTVWPNSGSLTKP